MQTLFGRNANIFKAFCDEKPLRILDLLRSGEKCACVLMEAVDMPQSTLSYHMKVLCEAGVVLARQDGKWKLPNQHARRGDGDEPPAGNHPMQKDRRHGTLLKNFLIKKVSANDAFK